MYLGAPDYDSMLQAGNMIEVGVKGIVHELDMVTSNGKEELPYVKVFSDIDPLGMTTFVRGFTSIPGPYLADVTAIFCTAGFTFDETYKAIFFEEMVTGDAIRKMLEKCSSKGMCLQINGRRGKELSLSASQPVA